MQLDRLEPMKRLRHPRALKCVAGMPVLLPMIHGP